MSVIINGKNNLAVVEENQHHHEWLSSKVQKSQLASVKEMMEFVCNFVWYGCDINVWVKLSWFC